MKLSVVIPTKNRASELAIVMRDLLSQTLLPAEIVIIDQSADDYSRLAVMEVLSSAPAAVRDSVQLQYVLDPSISGLAAARNRSIEIATGEILLFLDDDVELERDFLEQMIAVFQEYPNVTAVCGVITNYLPPPWPFRLWNQLFFLGPFFDERQPIYWNADRLRMSAPIRVHKLNGGAMAFRTELLRTLRFDKNLTGVSLAEDVDFAARVEPGVIVMAPRARLIHKRSPHGRVTDHWLRAQAQASHYLYRRNWRHGLPNRLRFLWLNAGYVLAIALCCLKQKSSEPLAAFRQGIQRGREASDALAGAYK